jgi:hypothetical protein
VSPYCTLSSRQSVGESKPGHIENVELIFAQFTTFLVMLHNQYGQYWIQDSAHGMADSFAIRLGISNCQEGTKHVESEEEKSH